MNNNGEVDGDSSDSQKSFEGKDGVDILAFADGQIDIYQFKKLFTPVDGIIMSIGRGKGPNEWPRENLEVGYDTDKDGEVADDGCYFTFHQKDGFSESFNKC